MRRRMVRLLKDNSGATLVFVAVSIFALAGMAVLGVDIARLLVARAQLQNASDAGALGGAKLFLETAPDPIRIDTRAREVARMNTAYSGSGPELLTADQVERVSVNMANQTVTVVTRSEVSQYFTGVVGRELFGTVRALATARAGAVCDAICIKPWSIPDRWDDTTPVPGYPGWLNNARWDSEKFTDTNGNRVWEPGENYEDGNNNNKYDSEFYHPIITGYIASRDHGLAMTLKVSNPDGASSSGQFYPIDLPQEDEPYVGADRYRWNIANCNPNPVGPGDLLWTENGRMPGPTVQGMRELYDKDPNAYWDDGCACVQNSDYPVSPRIGIVPLHDPRIPLEPGKKTILVTKLAGFFIERVRNDGEVVGRFMRVRSKGEPCPPVESSGDFVWNLSLIE